MRTRGVLPWLALLLFAASSSPAWAEAIDVAGRPLHVHLGRTFPTGYRPLLILLHGYGTNASQQATYLELAEAAETRGMIFAALDGTRDPSGRQFWNAGACCQFITAPAPLIDDVSYLDAVIDELIHRYKVDLKQIYLIAHSNGSFLAHRYACQRTRIAAIATLSGAQWSACPFPVPTPVSVLHIHATHDRLISYGGTPTLYRSPFGQAIGPFNGAQATVEIWAYRNRCVPPFPITGNHLDLVRSIVGAETVKLVFDCPRGGEVELWRIDAGDNGALDSNYPGEFLTGHVPEFNKGVFATETLDWLLRHPKP